MFIDKLLDFLFGIKIEELALIFTFSVTLDRIGIFKYFWNFFTSKVPNFLAFRNLKILYSKCLFNSEDFEFLEIQNLLLSEVIEISRISRKQ